MSDESSPYTGPKVFGIGFHKTGTTSLYAALNALGLRVSGTIGYELDYPTLEATARDLCVSTAGQVDAVEDMPWPLYFRDLDLAFPGSKFILTVRDLDDWYASVARHFKDHAPPMHALTYGPDRANALEHREHWIATHQAHIDAVTDWFTGRENDLLVMDFAAGDGWDKLCPFLGLKAPAEAFPQKNTRATRQSWRYRLLRRWHLLRGQAFYPEDAA